MLDIETSEYIALECDLMSRLDCEAIPEFVKELCGIQRVRLVAMSQRRKLYRRCHLHNERVRAIDLEDFSAGSDIGVYIYHQVVNRCQT